MAKLLKKHIKWYMDRITRDRLDSSSAHAAFFIIISFLPFVAFLLTLMQQIHFSSGMTLIERALNLFPPSVAAYISALLPDPISTPGVMPLAIITALWSSSMGVVAIIKGLDLIFEAEETRGYVHLRFVALVFVFLLAVALLVTALLLVFGSTLYRSLLERTPPIFAAVLINFKSLAGFILLLAFFLLMYTLVPRRRAPFRCNLAGAAFSAGGWVLFSYFFSLFVENFFNATIYGGLATLVILMFWLFFCMYILFLGAEVSTWLEKSGIGLDLKNFVKKQRRKRTREKAKAALERENKQP